MAEIRGENWIWGPWEVRGPSAGILTFFFSRQVYQQHVLSYLQKWSGRNPRRKLKLGGGGGLENLGARCMACPPPPPIANVWLRHCKGVAVKTAYGYIRRGDDCGDSVPKSEAVRRSRRLSVRSGRLAVRESGRCHQSSTNTYSLSFKLHFRYINMRFR